MLSRDKAIKYTWFCLVLRRTTIFIEVARKCGYGHDNEVAEWWEFPSFCWQPFCKFAFGERTQNRGIWYTGTVRENRLRGCAHWGKSDESVEERGERFSKQKSGTEFKHSCGALDGQQESLFVWVEPQTKVSHYAEMHMTVQTVASLSPKGAISVNDLP